MAAKHSDDEYDEDIGMMVGNPLKHGDYDNEGNYKEKEAKEEKKAAPLAALKPAESVKSESRNEKYKRLMREKAVAARKSTVKGGVGKGVRKSTRKKGSRAKKTKRKRSMKRRTIRRK